MQLKKVAVLGNVCFWLTLLFQIWKPARELQQDLLNTLVMLGWLAVLFNVSWIFTYFVKERKVQIKPAPTQSNDHPKQISINQIAELLFTCFNLLSFAVQLIFVFTKFL
jgi:heme/copper-type cytochrome/quinol oxidase subunit 2